MCVNVDIELLSVTDHILLSKVTCFKRGSITVIVELNVPSVLHLTHGNNITQARMVIIQNVFIKILFTWKFFVNYNGLIYRRNCIFPINLFSLSERNWLNWFRTYILLIKTNMIYCLPGCHWCVYEDQHSDKHAWLTFQYSPLYGQCAVNMSSHNFVMTQWDYIYSHGHRNWAIPTNSPGSIHAWQHHKKSE